MAEKRFPIPVVKGLKGGSIENICEYAWKKHNTLYVVKWYIRNYPPHSLTFAHFYSQKCSFSASWTIWHLSLNTLILVCCLPTNYFVRASPYSSKYLAADNRENWLVILIIQMFLFVWLFFSEKLSLADRTLSVWSRFLTITLICPQMEGTCPSWLSVLIVYQPPMGR